MSTGCVRVEHSGAGVRVTLDRPPVNVLDLAMLEELASVLGELGRNPGVTAVLLTGAGKAFSAGVDVADHTADRVDATIAAFHRAFVALAGLECPVLAAVNGAALGGGCELLLACDLVIARDGAKLGQPEIRLGVFPPVAAALLPRLIGRQRALDLILTGRTIPAREALELGLVGRVVPPDDFPAAVEETFAGLLSLSRPVLRLTKRVVLDGLEGSAGDALRRAEAGYLQELLPIEDSHEGLAAFLEKRPPVWKEG